jgi:hypothetical protein
MDANPHRTPSILENPHGGSKTYFSPCSLLVVQAPTSSTIYSKDHKIPPHSFVQYFRNKGLGYDPYQFLAIRYVLKSERKFYIFVITG